MAITTKRLLCERIRRILSGGFPADADRVQDPEIIFAIGSVANGLLKGEMYNTVYNTDGESIPQGAMIATYEKIPVTRGLGIQSVATLPIQPLTLPERQGVFSVYPTGYPEAEYIPLPPGLLNFWKNDKLVNPLNRRMYTAEQKQVIINDDLIGAGITQVDMKLCILDISQYEGNEPLPITPDQEVQIINAVVEMYKQEPKNIRSESNQPQPE